MKFALSTLSTAVMTITFMGLAAPALASATDHNFESPNEVTAVAVTQISTLTLNTVLKAAFKTSLKTRFKIEGQRQIRIWVKPSKKLA